MKKADRQKIHDKYGGKCAYCGCDLPKRWHVDHVEPVVRDLQTGVFEKPERHCIENMNPSCPSCNVLKNSMPLESFRKNVANFVNSLNNYSTQYKVAKRYGLVEETGVEVIFYFEIADKI